MPISDSISSIKETKLEAKHSIKTAYCFRHVAFEDLGSFEDVLLARGYKVKFIETSKNSLSNIDPLHPDLVIVLGGPIGVYEADDYPFLKQEIAFLKDRLSADKPTLGICLGSQLIACALGAKVYSSGRSEIGWGHLILTEAGKQSCLAALSPDLTSVLHWHGDTFDLPEGATLLASTPAFPNQAFAWGKHCLGLQFHAEVTGSGLEGWFVGHTLEIKTTPGLTISQLRADTQQWSPTLEKQGSSFLNCWLDQIESM